MEETITMLKLNLILTAFGLTLAATAAYAGAADDAITGRQACMKAHGASMKVMVPMMKGEAPYDNAAIQATLDAEGPACANWDKWWSADVKDGGTLKTHAKPEIWSDPKGFADASGVWYKAFTAVKASADEASFKAAFPALGAGCGGCHEKFRTSME
jgi:cytochrome c556